MAVPIEDFGTAVQLRLRSMLPAAMRRIHVRLHWKHRSTSNQALDDVLQYSALVALTISRPPKSQVKLDALLWVVADRAVGAARIQVDREVPLGDFAWGMETRDDGNLLNDRVFIAEILRQVDGSDALTIRTREAFLRILVGQAIPQIAVAMCLTANNVRQKLFRARTWVRAAFSAQRSKGSGV